MRNQIRARLLNRALVFGVVAFILFWPAKRYLVGLRDHLQFGIDSYFADKK